MSELHELAEKAINTFCGCNGCYSHARVREVSIDKVVRDWLEDKANKISGTSMRHSDIEDCLGLTKPKSEWCSDIVRDKHDSKWIFDGDMTVEYYWKVCPMCLAKRPEENV